MRNPYSTGGDMSGGASGGDADGLRQIMQLLEALKRDELDQMSRYGEARKKQREEEFSGLGGLRDSQVAMINSGPRSRNRGQLAATAMVAEGNRALRAAGLDPEAPGVDQPRPGETREQYVARIKQMQADKDKARQAAAGRIKAQTQKHKFEKTMAGRVSGGTMVKPVGGMSSQQRTARAASAARSGDGVGNNQTFADAQAYIANPGKPLPATPPSYKASFMDAKGRTMDVGSDYGSAAEATDAARRGLSGANVDEQTLADLKRQILLAKLTNPAGLLQVAGGNFD